MYSKTIDILLGRQNSIVPTPKTLVIPSDIYGSLKENTAPKTSTPHQNHQKKPDPENHPQPILPNSGSSHPKQIQSDPGNRPQPILSNSDSSQHTQGISPEENTAPKTSVPSQPSQSNSGSSEPKKTHDPKHPNPDASKEKGISFQYPFMFQTLCLN